MTLAWDRLEEAHFKQIVDKASYLLIEFFDTKGNIVYVNKAWKEKMGYNEQDLQTLTLWDIIHPDSHDYCRDIFTRVNSGESVENIETLFLTKSGRTFPVQGNVNCMFDRCGNVSGTWGIFRDVTGRRKSLQALWESEERYRLIFENVPIGVVQLDKNGLITDCNDMFVRIIGSSRQALLGLSTLKLPDKRVVDCIKGALSGKITTFEGEYISTTADKTTPARVLFAPFETGRDSEPGAIGIIEDITERMEAEKSLRENEKYNRSILEVIPDIIIRADQKGRYLDIITSSEDKLIQPREHLLGRTAEELLPPDASGIIMEGIRNSLKTRSLQVVDYKLPVPAGKLSFEARIVPSGYGRGQKREVLLLIRDITDSKKREEELLQNQKRAAKQRAAIAGLVHDEVVVSGELGAVFNKITEVTADTIEVDRASIWILNDRGTELECLSLFEADERKHSSGMILNARDIPRYFEAILAENRIYTEDACSDPRTSELSEQYLKPLGITSMLDAGIVFEGKIKGVICLEHIGPHRKWRIDEESFASLVASLAGQALVNCERRDLNRSLQFQLDYERVVADISSSFVSQGREELDDAINYALQRTSLLFEVDRNYLFQFSADTKTMSNTHEWCAENTASMKERNQDVPLDYLPWFISQIRSKDHVYINDLDDLPPEAEAEKKIFDWHNMSSMLCVPMYMEGKVAGFFGFDTVNRCRVWNYEHIVLLKVIAELIAGALARHHADKTIRYLSFHDRLTGLYNRHFLEEEMDRLDTERQLPISMIMADLNGLKLINDTYGHAMGDELLKAVAGILTRSCRGDDIIARWGGDEFIVLLPRTPPEEADRICRRIARNSRDTFVEGVPVSIALGVGNKSEVGIELFEVLRRAEDDMYKQKLTESRSTKNAVLQALLKTLAEKSFETEEHTRRMQEVAQKIGRKIDLPDNELRRLDLLITLHDIGKINIAEDILSKKGSLSEEEWEQIRRHPEIGYKIARATEDFSHVAEEILCHHERWDGSGYPRGLKKDEIPLLARITALADAFEVMSNGRPYKKVMSLEEILNEFKRCAGSHFDPELVELFIPLITPVKKNNRGR